MKIRDAQLQHRFPVTGDTGVWTFNVNLVDPVTEFKIWVFAKVSEHDALADQCLPYCISEVALIDGSEVIQAMTCSITARPPCTGTRNRPACPTTGAFQ